MRDVNHINLAKGGGVGGLGSPPQRLSGAGGVGKKLTVGVKKGAGTSPPVSPRNRKSSIFGDKNSGGGQQENVVTFESEPVLTLPKKAFPKLGRMKKTTFAVRIPL